MLKSEWVKSLAIGAAALLALLLWLSIRPAPPPDESVKTTGERLFEAFHDPAAIKSLSIVRFSGVGEEPERLELLRDRDSWRIPTRGDAPADNAEKIASVVSPLTDLSVLEEIPSGMDGDEEAKMTEFHRRCGLLDPERATGDDRKNAAIHLTILGTNDERFVDLLIGGVPEESSGRRDLRYVRIPGRNNVWTVDFSAGTPADDSAAAAPYAERLSTDPLDWMNRDLLRVSRWNIARLSFFKYSVTPDGKITPASYEEMEQDPEQSLDRVWSPVRRLRFTPDGKSESVEEGTAIDVSRVNESADALGHLMFTGLERKPDPLPSLFRERVPIQELSERKEALAPYGFYIAGFDPLRPESPDPILTGDGGTARLTMKDGVVLDLIFGKKSDGEMRPVLVRALFDPEFFPTAEPLSTPDGADEKERERIASENRLRESERALNLEQGQKSADALARRFDDWFFRVSEEDYKKVMP